MSKRDSNFKVTPLLGVFYRKIGKVFDEVDHLMSQDRITCARNQLQTVGENVNKLGSHVLQDLPLPAFLASNANSTSSAQDSLAVPETNPKVTDIGCPAVTKPKLLAEEEHMNPYAEELNTVADFLPNLKDNHWSRESLGTNVDDDSKIGAVSTSEDPDLTCSNDDAAELSSDTSLTIIAQDVEHETRDQIPTSSKDSDSAYADGKGVVISLPQNASINKDQEDADKASARTLFSLTTKRPQSDLPQPAQRFCDTAVGCGSGISTVVSCSELVFSVTSCQSESADQVESPSSGSNSSLAESLNLVEVSQSAPTQKEGKSCEDYFDLKGHVVSLCTIPPSLKTPRTQSSQSYLNDRNPSFANMLPLKIAGQSNSSMSRHEDLLMEKIDLSDNIEHGQSGSFRELDVDLSVSSSRCFNLYKKKFQNLFASNKKLERDYKLLAIRYGDIDAEFSQLTCGNEELGPVVQNKEVLEDSDWEVV